MPAFAGLKPRPIDHPDSLRARTANRVALVARRVVARAGPSYSLGARGAALIAFSEGVRQQLYNDPVGHCTVGIGHLVHYGRCTGDPTEAPFADGLSVDQCYELLRVDMQRYMDAVSRLVRVPLNQNQADALGSFTMNVGEGNLGSSTLLRRLNAGEYAAVPSELMKWVKASGITLPGLVTKRAAEAELFLDPSAPPPSRRRSDDQMPQAFVNVDVDPRGSVYFEKAEAVVRVFSDNVGKPKPGGGFEDRNGCTVRVAIIAEDGEVLAVEQVWATTKFEGQQWVKPAGKAGFVWCVGLGPNDYGISVDYTDDD